MYIILFEKEKMKRKKKKKKMEKKEKKKEEGRRGVGTSLVFVARKFRG